MKLATLALSVLLSFNQIMADGFRILPKRTPSLTKINFRDDSSVVKDDEYARSLREHLGEVLVQEEDIHNPKLEALAVSLMAGSNLMYAFAALRKHTIANENLPDGDPNKVNLKEVELILTQKHQDLVNEKRDFHRYLKHEVTGADLNRFMTLNRDFVERLPHGDVSTEAGAINNIYYILDKMAPLNMGVREFDDQFNEKQLVYGITVNRTDKRITVFFRGSVTDSRDWPTNLNALPKSLEVPAELEGEDLGKKIKVHRGFHSYLNEKLNKKTGKRLHRLKKLRNALNPFYRAKDLQTKFDEIEGNLRHILSQEEFHDYKVYTSGHSLGGALSQLLAYQLAAKGSLKGFKKALPVTAITYASPMVGNQGFAKAFERLEKKGLLRHLRISNAGDIVPVSAPLFGYTQTGINFHVNGSSKMEVGYQRNHETIRSQVKEGLKSWREGSGRRLSKLPGDMLAHHSCAEYFTNLLHGENEQFLDTKTIEGLYAELVHQGSV